VLVRRSGPRIHVGVDHSRGTVPAAAADGSPGRRCTVAVTLWPSGKINKARQCLRHGRIRRDEMMTTGMTTERR